MLARAARPKLSLAVPTLTATTSAAKSPLPRAPMSPSPISPTVHNTRLNQRCFSSLQPPALVYNQISGTKGILKKGAQTGAKDQKLQFKEEAEVRCVTPMPVDYHGTYVKMSKEEKRWGLQQQ